VLFAQQEKKRIQWNELIENNQGEIAQKEIESQINSLIQQGKVDSIPGYVEIYGRALSSQFSSDQAEKKLLANIKIWEGLLLSAASKRRMNVELSYWYEFEAKTLQAYQALLEALDWAKQEQPIQDSVLNDLYISLGGLAVQNMDLPAAKGHLGKVLQSPDSDTDPESIYFANSYLGNISYFTSNLDSATFYYGEAIDAIDFLEPTPRNLFYRKGLISNNLAGVYMAQGDYLNAENAMSASIENLENYQLEDLEPLERQKIERSYFSYLDNLAGLYKQQGFYHKATKLLEYSYDRKNSIFGETSTETAKSKILLGQIYLESLNIEKARTFLNEGLELMENSDGGLAYWEGDAIYALARVEDFEENEELADSLYTASQAIFEDLFQGEFDVIYLGYLVNYSKFLAENGKTDRAIQASNKARNYLASVDSDNLQLDFYQTLNLASIYELGNLPQSALTYADQALSEAYQLSDQAENPRDSVQALFLQPGAILIRNRSRYALAKTNLDEALLESIEKELREGLVIIDSQSDFLMETSDINIQLGLNQEYFDFIKKIEVELYGLTQNETYLDRLLAYQEYARYRKIRSRLQRNEAIQFGGVPNRIAERELELKELLETSLSDDAESLTGFRSANNQWGAFLDSLKTDYPAYYQIHFQSSENTLTRISEELNPEISYLRYFKVGEKWMVLLLQNDDKTLVELDEQNVDLLLERLTVEVENRAFSKDLLYELYLGLWEPTERLLKNDRVVIIPDEALFNLNFEMLTSRKVESWSELPEASLLAKHSFSYQYGLLLLPNNPLSEYKEQMVAFAPGFSDSMKESYRQKVEDNQRIDQAYLQLIPQPFTRELVHEMSSSFVSRSFLEGASTVRNFVDWAGNNQVIHIGTHAFADNVNPGDSRLVFAKSAENPQARNELFATDIYSLDLSSELVVLLACEAGKPAFSPGEGMVSLAHAFNYSGAKSLLLGLWKIDEKASTQIAEDFYLALSDGLTKDEALQKAKLDYLAQAKGRELDPAFWAGLMLLGDPEEIALKPRFPWLLIVASIAGILILFIFLRKRA